MWVIVTPNERQRRGANGHHETRRGRTLAPLLALGKPAAQDKRDPAGGLSANHPALGGERLQKIETTVAAKAVSLGARIQFKQVSK
ncbi:hypothetical protein [uncultured Ferrimonas sp.]|uniref:hypothetical protein n=1 Tax=uncultured Ferrimonas sp. TaxID=432640 RepID=UPI00262DBA1C|nr:hypothetical protein [uncultured Ferrimonas sp.]